MESSPPFLSTLEKMGDYDPNSMPVEKARQFIQKFLTPLTEHESIDIVRCTASHAGSRCAFPHECTAARLLCNGWVRYTP